MRLHLKTIILDNAPLKIISLILGFTLWYIFSQGQTISVWLDVPISFYDIPEHMIIHCPETIAINITGKRVDLLHLSRQHMATHINAQNLPQGISNITITPNLLFLPNSVKLLHYNPSNITVKLTKKNNSSDQPTKQRN